MGVDTPGGGASAAGFPSSLGDTLAEAGETGRLLRGRDWAASALGPPALWPAALRTAIRLCLGAPTPRLLWWGPELVSLYNDSARVLLGTQHPGAFGRPAREEAPALWNVVGSAVLHVAATAEPVSSANQLLMLERRTRSEECYFSFAYFPILDEGGVAGVLCAAEETTARVLAARRRRTLARLREVGASAPAESEAWRRALDCLERNPADMPFALLYRIDDGGDTARLAGSVGLVPGSGLAPERVSFAANEATVWPLARAASEALPVHAPGAFVLPFAAGEGGARGLLVAGLNGRLPLDDAYRGFVVSVAERVGDIVARAEARSGAEARAAELERARAALGRRCAELTGIIEQAPVQIVVCQGPSFVVTMANAAARAASGGRPLLDRPLFETFKELGSQGIEEGLREVLRTGQQVSGEAVPVRLERGGEIGEAYFSYVIAPFRKGRGDIGGLIVIANEVTEQVVARETIRASEARYRGIFDTVDVSIWEQDYSGVRALLDDLASSGVADLRAHLEANAGVLREALERVKVRDVNRATLRLFGATRKEQLRDAFPRLLAPEGLAAFGDILAAIAAGRQQLQVDGAVRTLAGQRREVMITMAARLDDPNLQCVLITLADITERKRMEAELLEADRRKDEFLATLAHELRNPLAPLRNCVELLRAVDSRPAPVEVLDIVARQVEHLVRLVDDLLETSRISRGAFELRRERVLLTSVVRNALETSGELIREAGHELEVKLPEEQIWLDGDPVRLAQILANVLNNAAKYTPPGGRVSLTARREGAEVAITIADTGIGIPEEALPRLFTLFNRLGAGSGSPAGLGIGLALARRLAEMHGGTLEAQSEGLGKGSQFTVRLPLATGEPPAERSARARTRAPLGRWRVLVVDDNRDAADTLAMLLEASGADVRVAYTGAQALEAFAVHDSHVALLDIGMPGMDGYELVRRLRAEFPDRRPVLVALTGWGQEHDRRRAREAGFDHHLVKPPDIGAVQALIESLDDRWSEAPP